MFILIGNRPWKSSYFSTSDCWYNIIKVVNDDYAFVIGLSGFTTFFDLHRAEKKFILGKTNHRTNGVDIYAYDEVDSYRNIHQVTTLGDTPLHFFSLNGISGDDFCTYQQVDSSKIKLQYTFQDFFGITDWDILSVVAKLKEFDWDGLLNDITYRGIYICRTIDYKEKDEDYDPENIVALQNPYNESSNKVNYIKQFNYCEVNDSFDAIALNNDESKIYAWHSPCMEEERKGKSTQQNSFPYHFIPFDLSSEETWGKEYKKWKTKYRQRCQELAKKN